MANYATLKAAIQQVIAANGNNEITGTILQSTLLSMITSLGADYQFVGIASEATAPGTPDQNVAYIAGPGTYPNFNAAVVPDGHIAVFKYNGSWVIETTDVTKKLSEFMAYLSPLKDYTVNPWWLNVTSMQRNTTCGAVIIPVKGGESVEMTIGARTAYFYVTQSIPAVLATPEWATGYTQRSQMVAAQSPLSFTLPSDARYIILATLWYGNDCTPSSLKINGYDLVKGIVEEVAGKQEQLTFDDVPTEGSDNPVKSNGIATSLVTPIAYKNLAYGFALSAHSVGTQAADGTITCKINAGQLSSNVWEYLTFALREAWKENHRYYISVDMLVTQDSQSESSGQFSGIIQAKKGTSVTIATATVRQRVQHGVRGRWIGTIDITGTAIQSNPDAQTFFMQFGRYGNADYMDIKIYSFSVIDMGLISALDKSFEEVNTIIALQGYFNTFNAASYARSVYLADNAKNLLLPSIDIWGDSLTANNWGAYLQTITGRSVTSHGYGGRTSTYIRDKFLEGFDAAKTNIIWVGRNNNLRPYAIVEDIRAMINALGTDNFLIMSDLNGAYSNEFKGHADYDKFVLEAEILAKSFPSNFVDIREAIIKGWQGGNIRLLASFVQPNVGASVTINVSDATFLTTINAADITYIGANLMNKIAIGANGVWDIYEIVERVDDTHVTVTLSEANRVQPGGTVQNLVDPAQNTQLTPLSTAIEYLQVLQNGDRLCIYDYDTTPSTSRVDAIHQTEMAKEFTARVIARKLAFMRI